MNMTAESLLLRCLRMPACTWWTWHIDRDKMSAHALAHSARTNQNVHPMHDDDKALTPSKHTSPQVRDFGLVTPGARTTGSLAVTSHDFKCSAISPHIPNIAHVFTEDQRANVDATSAPDSHLAEQHTADSNNLRLAVSPD